MLDIFERLTFAIRTVSFLEHQAADEWVRTTGLTRQQARTLGYLAEHGSSGVTAKDLAKLSGTTAASVASLLQGLEDRGLIVRRPSERDSRMKLITATSEGATLVDGFAQAMRDASRTIYAPLSTREQEELLALLERLRPDDLTTPERPA